MFDALIGYIYQDLKRPFRWSYRRVRYAKKFKENEETLETEVEKLIARKNDIEESPAGNRTNECRYWIDMVNNEVEAVKRLQDESRNMANQSRKSIHVISRSRLSKEMEKKAKDVRDVRAEGEPWRSGNPVAEAMIRRGPPNLQGRRLFHQHTVRTLISFLREGRIRRIGICGMVGSGKTTILDTLKSNEAVNAMFSTVVPITILEDWGVTELQHEIMTKLMTELNFEGNADVGENGRSISEMLRTHRCLILLDNFEKEIDLDQTIGIRDNQNDSKVVFASRSYKICKAMKVDEPIIVDPLSRDDAWLMFKEIVGDVIDQFPRVEEIARLVAQECNGLPLLIDKVATNFREKGDNLDCWDKGLEGLRTWEDRECMNDVIKPLEICYEHLDDRKKKCFLYGALYSEECKIYADNLIEYWIAENFFENEYRFREGRNSGHSALDELIDVLFLVRIDNRKLVKMNKLLRNMALHISSRRRRTKLLVNPSPGAEWVKASRISLMDSELKELPQKLYCVDLLTLLLPKNKDLLAIPSSFFQSMRSLQVLDLHGTGVKSLPPSLSKLVSLRALYLNFCSRLKKLPSTIKSLKRLVVLDIRETKVDLRQIRRLTWLKCLRMSSSNSVQIKYTKGKISGFMSLEEFSIDVGSWHDDGMAKAAAEEVATLEHLTFLRFSFHNLECLQSFVEKSPRQRWQHRSFTFQFCVGSQNPTPPQILDSVDYPFQNSLKLVNTQGNNDMVSRVLMETDIFELINHNGVSKLSDFFGTTGMQKMLVCWIEECHSIEVIINGDVIGNAVLTHLKELHIKSVNLLERIWQGRVHPGSLAQLTTLTLSNCPNLTTIFSRGLIQELRDLQCLKVEECDSIVVIINGDDIGNAVLTHLRELHIKRVNQLERIWQGRVHPGSLAQLTTLTLSNCPNLRTIFSRGLIQELRDLQCLKVEECDSIVVIINGDDIGTHLTELHIKRVNQLERIWQGRVHPGSLAQLTTLTLSNCPNLKTIFSRGLIQEQERGEIEEITVAFEAERLDVGLPKVKILELTGLPLLTSILDDSFNWQWPSLEMVKISVCRNLRRLPFNNVNVPKLMLIEGEGTWWEALQWRDPSHKQNLQSRFTSN